MGINEYYLQNTKKVIDKFDIKNVLIFEIKKYICELYIDNEKKGIGFLCYIPLKEKSRLFPTLISNCLFTNTKNKNIKIHIFSDNKTRIIEISNDRYIYTSSKYGTSIFEIKPKIDKIKYFLQLDDNIYKDNSNELYEGKSIYIIEHSKNINSNYLSLCYGTLRKISDINKCDMLHLCKTKQCLIGSPILLDNNKVIGIQKENSVQTYDFNIGTFLKYPILEFINKKKANEIIISLKVEENDINKNIYFINNIDYNSNIAVKNKKIDLFINNKVYKFQKYFKPNKIGMYQIKLKFNFVIEDCSKMFYKCNNITTIDLSFFDSSNVKNASYMFSHCNNLLYINLSKFETINIKNMGNMFSHCCNLINLDLSSFNTESLDNINYMFYNCSSLANLDLSNFNTSKVIDMSYAFYNCKNLVQIDLSNFNTNNVIDMSYMFSRCKKLKKIDLTRFNTEKVCNMSHMFSHCCNLRCIDLSKFDTENVIDISSMFAFNENLVDIDISNFDCKNMRYINEIFFNCYNLTNVHFPSFNIKNIRKMSYMFHNCWNLSYVNEEFFLNKDEEKMKNIFFGCANFH